MLRRSILKNKPKTGITAEQRNILVCELLNIRNMMRLCLFSAFAILLLSLTHGEWAFISFVPLYAHKIHHNQFHALVFELMKIDLGEKRIGRM